MLNPISLHKLETDPQGFTVDLMRSFKETGFAVVSDHGVPQTVIEAALSDTEAFFALPEPVKRAYCPEGVAGQRGYTPFASENAKGAKAKDLKEFWHLGRDLPPDHPFQTWMPDNLSVAEIEGFDRSTRALYDSLEATGRVLLQVIATGLALPPDWFDDKIDYGDSILRLLHYPPVKGDPADAVRAAAHEDINVITLLLGAEEAGLEVKTVSGEWVAVNPPEGALVVNIGDMLQRLTNHVLPSTTHRVVNPAPERASRSRYSTPFFLHFNPDYVIRTLSACVTEANPNRYPDGIMTHDYLRERLGEIGLA